MRRTYPVSLGLTNIDKNAGEKEDVPVLGVILDVRGIPPYVSVSKLWTQTLTLLSEEFQVNVYYVNTFDINCNTSEYLTFLDRIDLLVLLSPYYSIDRTLKNIPAIVYGLGSLQKGGHWLYRNCSSFRVYDSLLLNCSACEDIFKTIVGSSAMKSYVIPLAIDPQIFYPRENKTQLRQKYNIPSEPYVLMYSGRINLQKNCQLLLSVLREIRKQHDAHLVFLGFFDNFYIPEFSTQPAPDSYAEFERLVKLFDLTEHISLIEHQSDPSVLAEVLSTADLGINLSTLINENFGFTQVEMQACGVPVICSDWGGMKDTVIHGKSGFRIDTVLTDYGVRVNFEQALRYIDILINNTLLRKTMSMNAVQHAEQYMFPHFISRFHQIVYDTLYRTEQHENRNDFSYHPSMRRIYEILQKEHGNARDIIWEHLHPAIDFEHYRLIVSSCATHQAQNLTWNIGARITKAFDWTMKSRDHFLSFDPRWNPSFELKGLELTGAERELLWQIDHQSRMVSELSAVWPWQELSSLLYRLTCKGLILQM